MFFLMSFFLAEKHIDKNRVLCVCFFLMEVGRVWVLCHKWLQMEEKYQIHILSWKENGNLKIMFTSFSFVPIFNQRFLCWINLPLIQVRNWSFTLNNDCPKTTGSKSFISCCAGAHEFWQWWWFLFVVLFLFPKECLGYVK